MSSLICELCVRFVHILIFTHTSTRSNYSMFVVKQFDSPLLSVSLFSKFLGSGISLRRNKNLFKVTVKISPPFKITRMYAWLNIKPDSWSIQEHESLIHIYTYIYLNLLEWIYFYDDEEYPIRFTLQFWIKIFTRPSEEFIQIKSHPDSIQINPPAYFWMKSHIKSKSITLFPPLTLKSQVLRSFAVMKDRIE